MDRKRMMILALYVAIILMMAITYFYIQPNFSYEQTHTTNAYLSNESVSSSIQIINIITQSLSA